MADLIEPDGTIAGACLDLLMTVDRQREDAIRAVAARFDPTGKGGREAGDALAMIDVERASLNQAIGNRESGVPDLIEHAGRVSAAVSDAHRAVWSHLHRLARHQRTAENRERAAARKGGAA